MSGNGFHLLHWHSTLYRWFDDTTCPQCGGETVYDDRIDFTVCRTWLEGEGCPYIFNNGVWARMHVNDDEKDEPS